MTSLQSLKKSGYVRVSNEDGVSVESSNLVVYNGGDILSRLLAGYPEYKISHMYFGFQNTAGAVTPVVPARTSTAAYFDGLSGIYDFVRAPVLSPPTLTASDADHLFNQALFLSISSAATGYHGVTFSAASNSKVYVLGLAASPTGSFASDILYAMYALPTALPAAGSGQISASWIAEND